MAQQYGTIDYWDDRYERDKEPFEWYQNYAGIRHFLSPKYLTKPAAKKTEDAEATKSDGESGEQKSSHDTNAATKNSFQSTKDIRVLIVGCGNSKVGEAMLSDGFTKITNVDFSSIVINQMKEKYTDEWYEQLYTRLRRERKIEEEDEAVMTSLAKPGKKGSNIRSKHVSTRSHPKKKGQSSTMEKMVFGCQDLTKKLSFSDESFDLILCKGTMDAVLCSANTAEKNVMAMNECHRVLDREGVMVIISYGDPENRLNCFDNNQWVVKTYTVPKPMIPGEKIGEEHYVYILFKI